MSGSTSDQIQIATNPAFSGVITSENVTGGNYNPARMSDGVYYWRVRAMTGSAAGEWSVTRSFTILTPAPAPMYFTQETPTLTWGRITWAAGYEIQIDDNADLSSPFVSEPVDENTLEFMTSALPNGKYYWRVRALPDGAWSAAQRFEVGTS